MITKSGDQSKTNLVRLRRLPPYSFERCAVKLRFNVRVFCFYRPPINPFYPFIYPLRPELNFKWLIRANWNLKRDGITIIGRLDPNFSALWLTIPWAWKSHFSPRLRCMTIIGGSTENLANTSRISPNPWPQSPLYFYCFAASAACSILIFIFRWYFAALSSKVKRPRNELAVNWTKVPSGSISIRHGVNEGIFCSSMIYDSPAELDFPQWRCLLRFC